MAKISIELIKELRARTGAGLGDCKKALEESNGDIEKAIDLLKQWGIAKAVKKISREAKDGLVRVYKTSDGKRAGIIELNCETDFVARTDEFQELADMLVKLVAEKDFKDVKELLNYEHGGEKIENIIKQHITKFGENIVLRRIGKMETEKDNLYIDTYLHFGSRLGVLLKVEVDKPEFLKNKDLLKVIHDLSLQIAALSPIAIKREEVPKEIIEKEKEIYREQVKKSGKPEKIVEKIVQGKIEKFYSEICLLEQNYFRQPEKTISEFLKENENKFGVKIEPREFLRFKIGEA